MKLKITLLLILVHTSFAFLDHQQWNGNQINNWWANDGRITSHVPTGDAGMEWPTGSGDSPVFAAGLWVTVSHVNGVPDVRSAAAEFTSEFVPGPMASAPEAPENRIYKIRRADGRANPDWEIWPVNQGAPWIDVNADGIYDPAIDSPDIKGDLYYWTVFNDGNVERHSWLWNTQPLGIEVVAASYGFEGPYPLGNTLFFEWSIKNVGTNQLDSVFVGVWQDIDLGSAINDYPGCSPELDLSYHYVGELPDRDYGMFPPAVGFTILEGPIVPSVGDTAHVWDTDVPDFKNLSSTAFTPFTSVAFGDPETATEANRAMRGLSESGEARINPITNLPDPFIFSGNPIDGTGWLAADSMRDGDWRGILSTGPFSMAPGETQHLTSACVISPGNNPLAALSALFDDVETIQNVYQEQFTGFGSLLQISEEDVPYNTESSGPFNFQFEITDPGEEWENTIELRYEFEDIWYGTELSNAGGSIWEGTLPDFEVLTTDTLKYYLRHTDDSGGLDYWPSGAPYNNRLLTFGPDTDPPIVRGLQEHYDVHYLLPFQKPVMIDTVYDDRFGIHDIWLNWTIGGSDIMTAPMVAIDSNEVNWRPNTIYQGEMADVVSQVGDTVKYWVTALDGSLSNLAGNSEVLSFVTANEEIIADFDHIGQLLHLRDWQTFEHGMLSQFSDASVGNWLNVMLLAVNAEGVAADTMEMMREIDLTPFDEAWFNVPMVASFRNAINYGLVQVKAAGVYHTLDSLYGSIPPGTYSYDLSPFLEETDVSLRFIMNRGFGSMRWIIDDIVFHTDPELVNVDKPNLLTNMFSLEQNYPNPFNPSTQVRYSIPENLDVEFSIYDLKGREVYQRIEANQKPGWYQVEWNGLDKQGHLSPTGVYFGHLQAGNFQQTIKMVLIR